MKKEYLIKNEFANTRLDRWFRKVVFDVPQSLIEKNIRKGNIKVNNKKRKSSYKLQQNDRIIIYKYDFIPNKNKEKTLEYHANKEDLKLFPKFFIEDNDNFVIINKPSGIAVQSGTKSRKNIIDILKKTKPFEKAFPFPVHRIDKDTTGILIVAKNRNYAQIFTMQFRKRMIHKTYLCIVSGELKEKKGTFIDELFYIEKEKKIKLKAKTHFQVIGSNGIYSLLLLNPETGRKHQLRKQMLLHGHPVLGDNKYNINSKIIRKSKMPLMLHAYKINFSINNKNYKFLAEPPEALNKIIKEKYLRNF